MWVHTHVRVHVCIHVCACRHACFYHSPVRRPEEDIFRLLVLDFAGHCVGQVSCPTRVQTLPCLCLLCTAGAQGDRPSGHHSTVSGLHACTSCTSYTCLSVCLCGLLSFRCLPDPSLLFVSRSHMPGCTLFCMQTTEFSKVLGSMHDSSLHC